MRKVLENFYYGNITPGEKEMRPGSELQRARMMAECMDDNEGDIRTGGA